MIRRVRWCVLVALLLPGVGVQAQEVHGGVEGVVLSTSGSPIPDAQVTVRSAALQQPKSATTWSDGRFRILALPVGRYTIEVRAVGFLPVTDGPVVVALGGMTTRPPYALEPSVILTPIEVTAGGARSLDFGSTNMGGNLSRDDLDVLPAGRSYQDALRVLPMANESPLGDGINVAGATGLANLFFVDGVNTTNPYLADAAAELPYNFIEEVQLLTGGYEAEYGEALGGIVNVVTRSGGNEWHGSLFGFFNNHSITAEERLGGSLGLSARGQDAYDVGFTLGGPLQRDRLWFFGAYDPSFASREVELPGLGFHSDERVEQRFAGKLTWTPRANTRIVASVIGDPLRHDRVQPGPFTNPDSLVAPGPMLNRLEEGGVAASLIATHDVRGRWLFEGRLAWQSARKYDGPRPGDTAPRYSELRSDPPGAATGVEIFSGGFGEAIDVANRRFTASASATLFAGSHVLKAGAEWEAVTATSNNFNTAPGVIIEFSDVNTTPLDCQTSFNCRWLVIYLTSAGGTASARYPSLFVQDQWSIGNRLRLNLGLRWDAQYFMNDSGGVAQSITDEWQPRLGFVYQLDQAARQKLSGSLGRYYLQSALRFQDGLYNGSTTNGIVWYDDNPLTGGQPVSATAFDFCCGGQAEVPGLEGSHYDEATLGFEQQFSRGMRFGVRGVYRTLRQVIAVANGIGNPGENGSVENLARPRREYLALEFSFAIDQPRYRVHASYVLSQNHGNYPGLFDSDQGRLFAPNENRSYRFVEQMANNTGRLPNDRPHSLKVYGAYRFGFGLVAGGFFSVQSGTPVSELGVFQDLGFIPYFRQPRGSRGRTPTVWDLDLRFRYDLPASGRMRPTVVLDVNNALNRREAVALDQFAELPSALGNPAGRLVNRSFLQPVLYAPPRSVRVGVEVGF